MRPRVLLGSAGDPPPAGLLKPERGFGKVWAIQSGVRERLGWALAAENGYTATLETLNTDVSTPQANAIVMTLPDGRVVWIFDGNNWLFES